MKTTVPIVYLVNNIPGTFIVAVGQDLHVIWPSGFSHSMYTPPVINENNIKWLL